VNFDFTDTGEKFVLALKNSVLNNIPNKQDPDAGVTLRLERALFNRVVLRETTLPVEILKGNVDFSGNPSPSTASSAAWMILISGSIS